MNDFTVLLAFGLPPVELARDLIKNLHAPALSTLLGKGRAWSPPGLTPGADQYARSLAHEQFLYQHLFGSHQLPVSAIQGKGGWRLLSPVHIHIARDHLVLTDQRQLPLSEEDSCALFDLAQPLFAESGMEIAYLSAKTWLVYAPTLTGLECASLDAACGHNIEIWLPRAANDQARAWRKLQNEVQMLWHSHAINEDRAERGLPPVNALWLWGDAGTAENAANAAQHARAAQKVYTLGTPQVLQADLWQHMGKPVSSSLAAWLGTTSATAETGALLYLDQLSASALSSDWGLWLQTLQELETQCFAPLLAALRQGQLRSLRLLLSDSTRLHAYELSPWLLRRFWRKPSFATFLS